MSTSMAPFCEAESLRADVLENASAGDLRPRRRAASGGSEWVM
eukprot:CAMPEP_0206030958 /NCGR_PEP_ID=MMETSP1464-20131121/47780_1 /ASSEMBLY_ACC=CAM_ASM_001124 /TAXON_ID=119497 /ORGANISM="Exanthemachrysis gayraliae, Strain RCC1523" /LENGTH=42 /DNA_ID= /DNA_START= /DNA_END= /DNA_ORIENTATION=